MVRSKHSDLARLTVRRSFGSEGDGPFAVPKRDDLAHEGVLEWLFYIRASDQFGILGADIG